MAVLPLERLSGITVKSIEETLECLRTKELEAQEIVEYPAYMERLNNTKNSWLFFFFRCRRQILRACFIISIGIGLYGILYEIYYREIQLRQRQAIQ